jgi:Spy/CpxP family protein refolding chaperone
MVLWDRGKEVGKMKTILKSLIVCSLLFLGFASLEGRSSEEQIGKEWVRMVEHKREKFHEKRLQRLCQELELSKEQEEKVSQIMKKGWEKIRKEMKKMRKRTLSIKKENDRQIEKLLTPEQLEKFKELKEETKRRKEKRIKKGYKKSEE